MSIQNIDTNFIIVINVFKILFSFAEYNITVVEIDAVVRNIKIILTPPQFWATIRLMSNASKISLSLLDISIYGAETEQVYNQRRSRCV